MVSMHGWDAGFTSNAPLALLAHTLALDAARPGLVYAHGAGYVAMDLCCGTTGFAASRQAQVLRGR